MSYHKFSYEEKLAAVELLAEGATKTEEMQRFSIPSRAFLNKWFASYRLEGPEALAPKPKGRRPKDKTQVQETDAQRIIRLEMEVAVKKIQRSFGGRRLRAANKAQIATSLEHKYSVKELCHYLGLAQSTFYYHRNKPIATDSFSEIRPLIREISDRSYRAYGYRRIHAALQNKHGISISGKTAMRLMREESRRCQIRKKKYLSH